MSYRLLYADGQAMLARDTPVVKASEFRALSDSLVLLETLRAIEAERRWAAEQERRAAREDGNREGVEQGRAEFTRAIAEIVRQAEEDRARRDEEVAQLALSALHHIAGSLGDEAMLRGVALHAVRTVTPQGTVTVEVAPAHVDAVVEHLSSFEDASRIQVRGDPALSERQCRIAGPNSRIIADLDHQLDAIAARWGADDE